MDRIKASQQKVLNQPFKGEATSHYQGKYFLLILPVWEFCILGI